MSRVLAVRERDTRSPSRILLLLAALCCLSPALTLGAPPDGAPVLRIQGSNTIGAKLAPALIAGLFEKQGLTDVRVQPTGVDNEQRVTALQADGQRVVAEIAAHGSSTGFAALLAGQAELAASSRPIKDSEAEALATTMGNLKSPSAEQVIAIDGLAVVVHPANPLDALDTQQLARIFAGEVKTWEELGGRGGVINLYARDDKSGTYDTFKELVLASQGKNLTAQAKRFESSEELSDAVSLDSQGIGFIGLPYVRRAKALAISAGDSRPMPPSATLVATEDYPLSRRLFLYNSEQNDDPWVRALVDFAHSAQGQAIVEQSGFVAQTVRAVSVEVTPGMPEGYQRLTREAQRLSVNFRFQEGSANLDNKALRDIQRVLDYLKREKKLNQRTVLVGFGDPKADPARAQLLSKLRAMAVRRELAKGGVIFREVSGFGDELPVAANSGEDGRVKNRRVEVWVY